jgi:hypothetical protein
MNIIWAVFLIQKRKQMIEKSSERTLSSLGEHGLFPIMAAMLPAFLRVVWNVASFEHFFRNGYLRCPRHGPTRCRFTFPEGRAVVLKDMEVYKRSIGRNLLYSVSLVAP